MEETSRLGEARQVLEIACEEARRRRHAEVEPIHLLHALVNLPAASAVLGDLGLEQPALRVACEAHLAWLPEVGSYRDGRTRPPISAALDALVPSEPSGGLVARILMRPTGALAPLVERLLADAGIAAIVLSDRSPARSIASIVTRATALAVTRGERVVRPEHALAVVTREPFFRDALARLGGDGVRVDEAIVAWLADLERGSNRPPTRLSKELSGVVEYTAFVAKAARPGLAPPLAFVVRLLAEPNAMALLGEARVDATDVTYVIVHGEAPRDVASTLADDDDVEIVFHNDDFTTQEFVVFALTEILRLPEMVARKRMLEVHAAGEHGVARTTAREARARRAEIVAAARRVGMPLRVSLRAVS